MASEIAHYGTYRCAGMTTLNTLRPGQNGRHFADDIFKCIFLNENIWITFKISLKFVPKSSMNNIPVLVQIMAWRRPGDKPLFEPMMVNSPTHICIIRPQWVKTSVPFTFNDDHNRLHIYVNIPDFEGQVVTQTSFQTEECQLSHLLTWINFNLTMDK